MRENPDTEEQTIGSRRAELYFSLPASSQRKLMAPYRGKSRYLWLTAAMCLIAVSGFALGRFTTGKDEAEAASQEIVSAHVRSLMVSHIADVASADNHTVKPWFDGKLDFAPRVPDLAASGFPLTGGRLDYIGNRQVAALVYARRKHTINLFEWPTQHSAMSPQLLVRRGYQIYKWIDAGFEYWAVSDVNAAELQQFTELLIGAAK